MARLFALSLVLLVACAARQKTLSVLACPSVGDRFASAERFIAHAGGAVGDKRYTNSLEAVEGSIAAGYRFIELDLIETSDGHLVAAHDWQLWSKWTGVKEIPPTLETFMKTRIQGVLSPLSLARVADIFATHRDLILVTDKTENFAKLAATFPYHDRLLVETFRVESLDAARAAGIEHVMPSHLWGSPDLEQFVVDHHIRFLALSTHQAKATSAQLRRLQDAGVCIYAFSSNTREEISTLFDNGVYGVYTDFFVPKKRDFSCERCVTY